MLEGKTVSGKPLKKNGDRKNTAQKVWELVRPAADELGLEL